MMKHDRTISLNIRSSVYTGRHFVRVAPVRRPWTDQGAGKRSARLLRLPHLASVHEEITDLRNELKQKVNELKRDLSRVETTLTAKIDHVDEKLANFENREIDKRLQLEVRVGRLEKQRDAKAPYRILCILDAQGHI